MRREAERREGTSAQWLSGAAAVGESIKSKDWTATALGAIEQWPQSLRTALGICLSSPSACCIAWGAQRLQLPNEKYAQLCGNRSADAIGTDFAQSWPQAWPSMRTCFERAFAGEPSLLENQRVVVTSGDGEDAALTFSFVPIHDESGGVGGVLISLLDPAIATLRGELERAQQDLDQFHYVVSHDFRSPLRTLESLAQLVVTEHSAQLPADALGLLNHITRGATKLAVRIDAVLRIAQLSQHRLSRRTVDVTSLVAGVIAELRVAAGERRVEVTLGALPEVDGDPELLRLAFGNILANAFKFTRKTEHASIEVSGRRQDRQNEYSIKDNGAGFEMKYAGKLFELFQRMHGEAEFEGMGVGLALARRLIERHGGTIRAEARRGEGATFYVTLPA